MAIPTLAFTHRSSNAPDVQGYQVGDRGEVIATKLDGGAARYRRDIIGGALPVACQYTLDRTDFGDWEDFYENDIACGADPFKVNLITTSGTAAECTVHIVPGSKKTSPISGTKAFLVQFQLEVVP